MRLTNDLRLLCSQIEFDYFFPGPVAEKTLLDKIREGEYETVRLTSPVSLVENRVAYTALGDNHLCAIVKPRDEPLMVPNQLLMWNLGDLDNPLVLSGEDIDGFKQRPSIYGSHLALVHNQREVRVYDLDEENGAFIERYRFPEGWDVGDHVFVVFSDTYVVASDDLKPTLFAWDRSTGERIRRFDASGASDMALRGSMLAYFAHGPPSVSLRDITSGESCYVEIPDALGDGSRVFFAGENGLAVLGENPSDISQYRAAIASVCEIRSDAGSLSVEWVSSRRMGAYAQTMRDWASVSFPPTGSLRVVGTIVTAVCV